MLTRTQESGENSSSSGIVHRKEAGPIVIKVQHPIHSVAVLVDGKHVVSGDVKRKIRRWRIEDGEEVGTSMDAGYWYFKIAVSRDGKWIVSGTGDGRVTVWNAESRSKLTEFQAHREYVSAVDISPDATKIVTASGDKTACVWSLSTGERLLGPLQHNHFRVVAAKFSPDGRLIATAGTFPYSSSSSSLSLTGTRVYDSQNGHLLVKFPVQVESKSSLAWTSDSKQLFALSQRGDILRLNVSTGITLSKWRISKWYGPDATCIALASNETFIAASTRFSVSFWDTTSQEQIGTVIKYTHMIESMAMSSKYDLLTGGDKRITHRALCGILPSHYIDDVSVPALKKLAFANRVYPPQTPRPQEIQHTLVANVDRSPGTFISTLIPVSDTLVHQTEEQRISREPHENCASSSPNLKNKPIGRGIPSPSHYTLKMRVRVCTQLLRGIFPSFTYIR